MSSRTFTIASATTINGCPTKKPRNSRYHSSSAEGAAKKAHTVLCGRKRIKGACTFILTMRETTQGSNKKLYTYKVTRHRLDEPVELPSGISYEYEVVAKKVRKPQKSRNCRKQSRGRMLTTSRRSRATHGSSHRSRRRSKQKSRPRKSRRRS